MLETIREFAAERLEELPGAAELHDRHAAWYAALGERAGPELRERNGREWLDRLEAEHANLRTALEHLVARGDRDSALRFVAPVWRYWAIRGHYTEARRLLAAILALPGHADPENVIEAMWGAAIVAVWQGDFDESERWGLRVLELARSTGSPRGEAIGHQVLGIVAHDRGDLQTARPHYERSLELVRGLDDSWFLSVATNNLGTLHSSEGNLERATELYEESLAIGEAHGDVERRARELNNLALIRYRLGDVTAARELYRDALLAAVEVGVVSIEGAVLSGLAECEAYAGNVEVAIRLLGRSDALRAILGEARDESGERERTLALGQAVLGPDRLAVELAAGAAMSREEAIDLALGAR